MRDSIPTHAAHGGDSFYAIGIQFDQLEGKDRVIDADILDAWFEPAPMVVEGIQQNLAWMIKTSPPTHGEGLIQTIASVRLVPQECILLGGGSSSLIYTCLPRLLNSQSNVVVLDPMYGEYDHILRHIIGIEPIRIALNADDNFEPNLKRAQEAVANADFVIWVNPNSPTGAAVSPEFLIAVLEAMPRDAMLWIDETYIDYVGMDASMESLVSHDRRVIVSKSMSKVYALSGLRVGYLAAHPEVIAQLKKYAPPWSVGLIAQYAAIGALESEDYYADRWQETHRLREALMNDIAALPWVARVVPSQANFFLFEVEEQNAARVCDLARAQNLFLRDCRSWGLPFGESFLRIAVKDANTNSRMLAILRSLAL